MASQPTVVVQVRKKTSCAGVDVNFAAVMKWVGISAHYAFTRGATTVAGAAAALGVAAAVASGDPGAAALPG